MQYMLQVMIYTALFYSGYLLFLKNSPSHQWNRFYLLLGVILPLILPFIKTGTLYNTPAITSQALDALLPAISIITKKRTIVTNSLSLDSVLAAIYLLISLALLSRIVYQLFLFRRFVKANKSERINGIKVLTNTNAGPGSFLSYIFLPGNDITREIFEHEAAHIKLMHSRDILFIRLLQSVFWPNLLLYFILKELKTVHEFQADAYAAKNEHSYINLLLNDIFSTRQFSMSNTFFCHPLKRRIMMLNKPVSRTKLRMAKSKAVILTALLAGAFVYLQSCKHVENTDATLTQQQKALSDAMKYPDISGDKKIYRFADVMPKPDYDLQAYLAAHIKYPGSARENSIQGRVIVRFVIDEGGNVISPSILRSPDTTLSEEALRVVGNMPKWRPGMLSGANVPVYFTMPIVFALDNGNGHDGLTDELTKEENDTLTGLLEQARTGAISVKDKNRMNELLKKLKK